MTSGSLYKELKLVLLQNKNETDAKQMSAYMKNQFAFYGIKSVRRKQLTKSVVIKKNKPIKSEAFKLVDLLWSDEHRELQYVAMEIMDWYIKDFDKRDIKFIEHLILNKSWWDTVDFIASHLVGGYFKLYSDNRNSICNNWSSGKNMWLQRTVILFQLTYKDNTDEKYLFKHCKMHAEQNDFFIRKAIGWALRQYSKTNPIGVSNFIKNTKLSPLSIKEGSKYL